MASAQIATEGVAGVSGLLVAVDVQLEGVEARGVWTRAARMFRDVGHRVEGERTPQGGLCAMPTCRLPTRRRYWRVLLAIAAVFVVAACGSADRAAPIGARFPSTPAGEQARWLLQAVRRLPIPDAELRAHFDQASHAAAAQLNSGLQGAGELRVVSVTTRQPNSLEFVVAVTTLNQVGWPQRFEISLGVDARGRIASFSPQPLEPPASRVPALARGWVAEPVTFDAGGVTIYGTYTRPSVAAAGSLPGALLIVGGGHNGPGDPYNTLQAVANWLSADGIASLRYDKLTTGKTGWDGSAADPARVGMQPFKQEAAAALAFLARQRSIDRRRLAVFGHSEGGLYALLLATGGLGENAPRVHALGLLEPLSIRVLDLIDEWVTAQVASARQAGHLSAPQANSIKTTVARAIASLRTTGAFPRDLPDWVASEFGFDAAAQLYNAQKDHYDPAAVAAKLTPQMPVFLTCSNADYEVSCGDVDHLAAGLMLAPAKLDIVHLDDVDHFLREDPSRGSGPYTKPLAFSPQLESALRAFTTNNL
jgi:alpha-beta hydrolase superfamily lysophospholipase